MSAGFASTYSTYHRSKIFRKNELRVAGVHGIVRTRMVTSVLRTYRLFFFLSLFPEQNSRTTTDTVFAPFWVL